MKLANAIEGGITGASTLTLLQKAIGEIDTKAPKATLMKKPGVLKKIRKKAKKGDLPSKLYIQLAGELMSTAAYYGLSAIGKKKNTMLRGGLLGAAAGIGSILFNQQDEKSEKAEQRDLVGDLLTLALYTSGGLLAGAAVKKWSKKKKKKGK